LRPLHVEGHRIRHRLSSRFAVMSSMISMSDEN